MPFVIAVKCKATGKVEYSEGTYGTGDLQDASTYPTLKAAEGKRRHLDKFCNAGLLTYPAGAEVSIVSVTIVIDGME